VKNNIDIDTILFDDFLKLPGVGIYTASAVFSIVKNQVYPVIDGNVKRVLSRILRLKKHPNNYYKKMNKFLLDKISQKNPCDFNQALMELGATLCKPKKTNCTICPINNYCDGYIKNDYMNYPIKLKNKKKPHYSVAAGIIWKNKKIIISKRKSNGLLGGLWEFPGGKIINDETPEECLKREILEEVNIKIKNINFLGTVKHEYSHFSITLNSYECSYKSGNIKAIECTNVKTINFEQIENYAFPKANHKIFQLLKNKYNN